MNRYGTKNYNNSLCLKENLNQFFKSGFIYSGLKCIFKKTNKMPIYGFTLKNKLLYKALTHNSQPVYPLF